MNVVEQYNLTLKIEVLKEQSAETLARLCKLVDRSGTSDCIEVIKAYSHIVNTELYLATSINELEALKSDMAELESNIKESLAQISHGVSDEKCFKENSDVLDIEAYSSDDFDKALERTIDLLMFNKNISSAPHAVILGGQSGAGKTTIHRVKMVESKGDYIVIDGDTYRAQHPHFRALQEKYGVDSVDYTKMFAGKMVEAVIDKLSSLKYNLIIEGTLRSAAVPINTATLLKSKGYTVDFCLIATKPELSYLTTQLRYLEMLLVDPLQARATPKEHHDGIVKSLVANITELEQSGVFESIQVYKRDLEQVYNSKLCTESIGTVVDKILFGDWTSAEKDLLAVGRAQEQKLQKQLY
ncbi:zeta toxin family protein [Veillonella sp. T11011-6]|uniref:zeta toxin family protein n=1 Tax=Veillonella sp. T11011-6 TaxID=2027459 RepID=UPI000CF4EB34|nr:zeta toxin family protein [Veillonella sp. T11011-6]PQL11464.1 zeta toxin [Veillonella sp. T11011-6]